MATRHSGDGFPPQAAIPRAEDGGAARASTPSGSLASETAHAIFRRTSFFASLDGLRAVSILAVVWHHTAGQASSAWPILAQGHHGVNLFFVISAFLITTLLVRARKKNALNVPRFWARRALRILPLYYAVLALYLLTVFVFEREQEAGRAFFSNLPAFATFTSNWFVNLGDERVIFYFAWSLAAEEQFYLCWPWVERFLPRIGAIGLALAGLVLAQLAGWLHASGATDAFAVTVVASVPAAILVGVVLAHLLETPRTFAILHAVAGQRGSAIVAAGVTLVTLSLAPRFGHFADLAVALSLGLLVCSCVVREDNDLAPFLRLRPVAWIGTVSYGIYLFHMLSVNAYRRVAAALFESSSPYADFVFGALLSIVVASLSYRTYESFFLARKERWFGDRSRPLASTVVPPVAAAKLTPGVPP